MRLLLPLLILGGLIFLAVRILSPRPQEPDIPTRPGDRRTRIADLEYQLNRAEHDLMTYDLRGRGLCPHCELEVPASAIKCENCEERFWMTEDEAIRSQEAGRARIKKLEQMLATLR